MEAENNKSFYSIFQVVGEAYRYICLEDKKEYNFYFLHSKPYSMEDNDVKIDENFLKNIYQRMQSYIFKRTGDMIDIHMIERNTDINISNKKNQIQLKVRCAFF